MTEGGENYSSVQGSDACFEYICTPCAEEGDNQEALKYCLECKEYLCTTCVKHHQRFSAMRNHILHDKDFKSEEKESVNTTSDDDELFKCLYHPDRDIEMYCGAHEMVYCSLCIAKEHRQCNGILELKEAAESVATNKKDVTLRQIESLLTDIKETRQKKSNLISLIQEKNDILRTIEDTEHLIIEKVKELASDAKTKTCIKYDELNKEYQDEDTLLLQAIANTNELRNKVETQQELDTKRQFARYILQNRMIAETEILRENVGKNEQKMKCFKNDELIQHVSSADCIVQILGNENSCNIKDNQVRKTLQKDVNIKGNGDKETCSIIGIFHLSDGTMILADRTNKKLRKLNVDFIVLEELDLEWNPSGLCLFDKTDVAVKLYNSTIVFFSVHGMLTKKQTIDIEGGNLTGLACIFNELWCNTEDGIKVYNKAGIVMKTFNSRSFEGTIATPVKNCVPIAADEEFIYVSDLGNKVICLDREGNVWSIMESERLKCVRRACISQNGIIFLAGYNSGNIMMFNRKGKCLGELVDGLDLPDSLCYDSETNQLLVGHRNMDTLTIIKTDE